MNVKLISGTQDPERLVCTAARNDYSTEGVIGRSYEDIMEPIEADQEDIDYVKQTGHGAKTRKLIRDLMNSGHWGPFEHPSATIALEDVTRVSMAQITRHRHFTFDIMSLRYVQPEAETIEDRFDVPEEIKGEEAVTREGVSELEDGVINDFDQAYYDSMDTYEELLDKGVPKEEARKVLPMGTKVNIVMSGNARAWMHLLNIRGKADVQGEARRIADGIMSEMKDWMPLTFELYDEKLPMKLNP